MATAVAAGIRLDEAGVPWIEGTRTKVIEVVRCQQANGYSPEELHEELPHLSVLQVEAAMDYYASHREELDADMERRRQWADELRTTQPQGPTRADLLARLNSNA